MLNSNGRRLTIHGSRLAGEQKWVQAFQHPQIGKLSLFFQRQMVQNHSLPKQSLILLIFYLTYLMFSRNICCFFYKKMINAISIAIDNLLLHPWLKKIHMRDKNDFKDTDLTKGEHWGNSWFSPKVEFKLRCSLSYSFLLLNSPCDINRVWRVRQCRWGPLTTTLWIRRRRFYSWLDHR